MGEFSLTSASFKPGTTIPRRHTCEGEDLSPPLAWSEPPAGTRSLARPDRRRSGCARRDLHALARLIPLTYDQFRYGFANAVSEDEAKELYKTFAVPASGEPLFQAAAANLNPWTEVQVDSETAERGPLLIISGEKDHTVPWAIANGSFKKQERNEGVTEIVEIANRGHALTIDSGWREVADTALAFVQRFAPAEVRAQ